MSKYIALDCERAVLGVLILAKDKREEILSQLCLADFGAHAHGHIIATISGLQKSGEWDMVMLAEGLRANNLLEEVGGVDYLASLIDGLPKEINPAPYIKKLKDCTLRRTMRTRGQEITILAEESDGDVLAESKALLDGVSIVEEKGAPHISEIAEAVTQNLEDVQRAGGRAPGMPTGLPFFDNYIGGIPFRSLVVIAGRPSVGKSAFCMSLSLRAAERGYKVGIISLEDDADPLITRMLSSLSRVNSMTIQKGRLSRTEWARFADAKARLSKLPIWVDEVAGTMQEIQARAHQFKAQNDIDVLVIDYLQIIVGTRSESRNVQVGEWTCAIKRLSKQLKCTVLLASQLNRSVATERRRPRLDDLRDSGSIEQDADMVVFLHDPAQEENLSPESPAPIELHVAKNRHGPKGLFKNDAVFIPAFTLFETGETK